MAEQQPPIEQLGPYKIVREIGHGGMGTVYQATDSRDGRTVAVKVLPPELARQRGFLNRFAHELEALSKLGHPNVVQILDVGEDNAYHYFVTEFVAGGSLERLLSTTRRLSVEQACQIARDVAAGLAHAHAHQIVHRDVKPANILLGDNGAAKLTDFGIAKLADATQLTVTGAVVGTADYLSPEQAEGRRVSPRSDLYSLGIVLYRMLSGRPPFSGRTTVEIVQKHRFARPTALYELRPGLPSRLYELVDELIAKDPTARPPNGQVVAERLDGIVRRLRGEDSGPDVWEKRMQERRQVQLAERRHAAIRAGGYLAVCVAIAVLAWRMTRSPSAAELWDRAQAELAADDKWQAMITAHRAWRLAAEADDLALARQARRYYQRLRQENIEDARMAAAAGAKGRRQLQALLLAAKGEDIESEVHRKAAEQALRRAERTAASGNTRLAAEQYLAIAEVFAASAPNQAKAASAKAGTLATRPNDAMTDEAGPAGDSP